MTPERNGVVLHFPNYGNRYARADVYRLDGFGYAFVANCFYCDGMDIDASVDTSWDDQVLEKSLLNQPHVMIIVPFRCVTVCHDWNDSDWQRK